MERIPVYLSALMAAAVIIFLGLVAVANCETVRLQWNPVAGADGYIIYYGAVSRDAIGANGNYPSAVDYLDGTTASVDFDGYEGEAYFAVTAYNQYGVSGFSIEVSTTVQCVLTADFDGDRDVDGNDFGTFQNAWFDYSKGCRCWNRNCDIDVQAGMNAGDYTAFAEQFGMTCQPVSAMPSTVIVGHVGPEPGAVEVPNGLSIVP